jgi:hypothetical protein
MSRCPEGHKCIWCGPKVAADRRDARGAQIEDWADYSTREERAMAAVEEDDKVHTAAAYIGKTVMGALKLAPPELSSAIMERFIGLMIAGHAFTTRQTIDEAWVRLRERAIAEQMNYEVNIKHILDARDKERQ